MPGPTAIPASRPVLELEQAALRYGTRTLWSDLDLAVHEGEFLAVLGPNGSGKTSFIRALLGQEALSAGRIRVFGSSALGGDRRIGYIPQQRIADREMPVRARDLVALGLGGTRWGLPIPSRAERAEVDRVLESVGATGLARARFGTLSGGEQQRVRVGQAIAGNVRLLLCDEPLLSLDMQRQREISELIDQKRRELAAAVVFVTHDVNPILDMVDRVLYFAHGRFQIGSPDAVLRSKVLTDLYGTPIEVIRHRGRIVVLGSPEAHANGQHHVSNGTR